jgi:hypothetical protein
LAADTAPTFTSATSVIFPQGIQDTFTINTSGNPVAKITSSGKLPGGVKFVDNGDGTATLSGRPGGGLGLVGDYSLTFIASNGVLPTGTQNFTLTITRPPRITSVNNATFVVGTAKNLYNYDSEFGAQIDLEFHRYLAERGGPLLRWRMGHRSRSGRGLSFAVGAIAATAITDP